MPKIFLSYRREDSAGYAGRVAERLSQAFGHANVFQDLEDIQPGVDFSEEIRRNVANSEVLVALIGPRWLDITEGGGGRRLDNPQDFVRLEILAALQRKIRVIPVLVQKAEMPAAEVLPEPLKSLAMHQAVELSDTRWDYDIGQLVVALGGKRPAAPFPAIRWTVAGLLAIALAGAGGYYFQSRNAGKVQPVVIDNGSTNQPGKVREPALAAGVAGKAVDVSGKWEAVAGQQGKEFRIRFNLEAMGDSVMGSVRYPTGEGGVHDGRIDGDRLLFVTRHTPQFEDKEVTISFIGKVSGDRIQFVMQTPEGALRFTANRVQAR